MDGRTCHRRRTPAAPPCNCQSACLLIGQQATSPTPAACAQCMRLYCSTRSCPVVRATYLRPGRVVRGSSTLGRPRPGGLPTPLPGVVLGNNRGERGSGCEAFCRSSHIFPVGPTFPSSSWPPRGAEEWGCGSRSPPPPPPKKTHTACRRAVYGTHVAQSSPYPRRPDFPFLPTDRALHHAAQRI